MDLVRAAENLRSALIPRTDEMLRFLEALVRIESHSMQSQGVSAVGDAVQDRLTGIGFDAEHVPGPMIPPADGWLVEIMLPGADYGTIADVRVLRKQGKGVDNVLLLGDLDTAFAPGSTGSFPFRLEEKRALGPGVADMKGGLVVLAFALQALEECGLTSPSTTTVVLSPDEQAGSLRSRPIIEAEAQLADWCLSVECARNGGRLMASRTHMGVARLDVYGQEAHAGSDYAGGVNAVTGLAAKIMAIAELTEPTKGIFATVTEVHGGRRRSVIPGHARCTVDLRVPDAEEWAMLVRSLERIAAVEDIPGARTELRVRDHRPAMPWTTMTDSLISSARRAAVAMGITIEVIRSSAGGSANFAGALGIPTLDGMGPAGGALMTDHEYIETPSIAERAVLLALLLHVLANPQEGAPTMRIDAKAV